MNIVYFSNRNYDLINIEFLKLVLNTFGVFYTKGGQQVDLDDIKINKCI